MQERRFFPLRNVVGQPLHETVHGRRQWKRGTLALTTPSRGLALEVIARLAKGLEPYRAPVDLVESRQYSAHLLISLCPLPRFHARQGLVDKHTPIDELHEVEGSAEDVGVVAVRQHPRNGNPGALQ